MNEKYDHMFATKNRKSEEYLAYCKLQHVKIMVAEMLFFLRTCEADDALASEAINIIKMIDELKDAVDDMFLDGYFKELKEKFEKEGL